MKPPLRNLHVFVVAQFIAPPGRRSMPEAPLRCRLTTSLSFCGRAWGTAPWTTQNDSSCSITMVGVRQRRSNLIGEKLWR